MRGRNDLPPAGITETFMLYDLASDALRDMFAPWVNLDVQTDSRGASEVETLLLRSGDVNFELQTLGIHVFDQDQDGVIQSMTPLEEIDNGTAIVIVQSESPGGRHFVELRPVYNPKHGFRVRAYDYARGPTSPLALLDAKALIASLHRVLNDPDIDKRIGFRPSQ